MTFLDQNWRKITLTSYTAWAFYVLAFLTLAPDILYLFFELDTNPRVWSCLQIIACFAGISGRLILQTHTHRWRRRFIIAIIISFIATVSWPALACEKNTSIKELEITTELIITWEGEHKIDGFHVGYLDIVDVPTICYGHTKTAIVGQRKTDTQCADLLTEDLAAYREGVRAFFSSDTKAYRMTPYRGAAYTSLAYNVGVRAAGRSTAIRRLNQANIKGGCEALTWWNRAGGRVVRGLVRRRSEERQYCLRGLI